MKTFIPLLVAIFLLAGCSFTPSESDVVVGLGTEIKNLETFERFFSNVAEGKEDAIRIVSYTDEGDPIIQDITFDGDTITAQTDSTRDEFGAGIVRTITCKAIDSKVEAVPEKHEEYLLTGCEPDDHDRSTISPLLTVY